jgi:threonine dehydrogenase-like Zn-dependent dehydrogenase
MLAVVAKGPYDIAVEERPIPQIENDTDAVVKVKSVLRKALNKRLLT